MGRTATHKHGGRPRADHRLPPKPSHTTRAAGRPASARVRTFTVLWPGSVRLRCRCAPLRALRAPARFFESPLPLGLCWLPGILPYRHAALANCCLASDHWQATLDAGGSRRCSLLSATRGASPPLLRPPAACCRPPRLVRFLSVGVPAIRGVSAGRGLKLPTLSWPGRVHLRCRRAHPCALCGHPARLLASAHSPSGCAGVPRDPAYARFNQPLALAGHLVARYPARLAARFALVCLPPRLMRCLSFGVDRRPRSALCRRQPVAGAASTLACAPSAPGLSTPPSLACLALLALCNIRCASKDAWMVCIDHHCGQLGGCGFRGVLRDCCT